MRPTPIVAIAALVASPAFADLTAEEVLAEHLNLLSGYGLIEMATTGTTERADGLTVKGFVGSYQEDDARVEIVTPGMTLTERVDGSVSIAYPDELALTINADPATEDPISVTLTLDTTGLSHIVSGEVGDIRHDIAFDTLALGGIAVDPPEAAEEIDLNADFAMAGFKGMIALDSGTPVRRDVELAFEALTLAMSMLAPAEIDLDIPGTTYDTTGIGETKATIALSAVQTRFGYAGHALPRHSMDSRIGQILWNQTSVLPGDEGEIDFSMNGSDLAVSYDVEMRFESLEDEFLKALREGQRMAGALNFSGFAYEFGIETPQGTVVTAATSEASENRFDFSESGLTLFSETGRQEADVGGPNMGLPINSFSYSIDRSMIDLAMPLAQSDVAQPFRFRMAFEGLATNAAIWDLFDPDARLPRDAANLVFDLDGTTVVAEDIFQDDPDVPFKETRARLNEFSVNIAGASVTGEGSVVDTSTDGVPSGIGELDLTITGVNRLIDTLVDMGLLPNEQAMGARMGLSLIARPDGEDRLVSKIEVNEEGQIFANGQRLK